VLGGIIARGGGHGGGHGGGRDHDGWRGHRRGRYGGELAHDADLEAVVLAIFALDRKLAQPVSVQKFGERLDEGHVDVLRLLAHAVLDGSRARLSRAFRPCL